MFRLYFTFVWKKIGCQFVSIPNCLVIPSTHCIPSLLEIGLVPRKFSDSSPIQLAIGYWNSNISSTVAGTQEFLSQTILFQWACGCSHTVHMSINYSCLILIVDVVTCRQLVYIGRLVDLKFENNQSICYLKHQTDNKHHCHTRHDVSMVLYNKLMTEYWRVLRRSWTSHSHVCSLLDSNY